MKRQTITNQRPGFLLSFTVACLLICSLLSVPAVAQTLPKPFEVESPASTWQAPDLAELPSDWWSRLNTGSDEEINEQIGLFLVAIEQRITGLVGEELLTAQNGISHIRSSFELLTLARAGTAHPKFEPPLAKDSYFLDDVLVLRSQVRELDVQSAQVDLQVEQAQGQVRLLQERRDKLVSEYASQDPEAPSRMLSGIKRVTARVEYELLQVRMTAARTYLREIDEQRQSIEAQLAFARAHLDSTDTTVAELEETIVSAQAVITGNSQKVSALQLQLLDALSADPVNPSLELLRKQQLTRASAQSELAEVQQRLLSAKLNWYRLRADELDSGFDLQASMVNARRFTADALKQAELWSEVSQATLITPPYDTNLNTVKNYEITQSVARDTLAVINRIKSTSDNLLMIQDIFTKEIIADRKGIGSTRARLGLVFGNTFDRMVQLADYHLFNIGDTPVTPAGLVKMLFIMAVALGISWLIRYLLARGLRRKRTAQSPAFYTLGRLLHYIIVVAGTFAALGSIGIDFTSFALIAGALSVGIGFGLQAIVSNFVSGLILLFEGTLRVGDYIELDSGLCGVVKEINTRATLVTTNDSVDVVVPNSELVTTKLTNWTLRETVARIRVPFGVAYHSDKELVRELALEACKEVDFALTNMPGREPQIRLINFGDSALEFDALIWVSRHGVRRPARIRASFLWALESVFRENDIEIPFPQRDVHVRSDFRVDEDEPIETDLPQD